MCYVVVKGIIKDEPSPNPTIIPNPSESNKPEETQKPTSTPTPTITPKIYLLETNLKLEKIKLYN